MENFEELREKMIYMHNMRNYSKRKRTFMNPDDKENESLNKPVHRHKAIKEIDNSFDFEPRRTRSSDPSSNSDPYEKYVPEKDRKRQVKYKPPQKSKKNKEDHQGRRTVKHKEINEYSEEVYGSLKRDKRPPPSKITCVTEIMADISDDGSIYEEYEIDSNNNVRPVEFKSNCANSIYDYSVSSGSKSMIDTNTMTFMN